MGKLVLTDERPADGGPAWARPLHALVEEMVPLLNAALERYADPVIALGAICLMLESLLRTAPANPPVSVDALRRAINDVARAQ